MKKIGGYLKSGLPFLVMLLVQMLVAVILMVRYILLYGIEQGTAAYQSDAIEVVLVTDLLLLGIMGLWYYIAVVNRRKRLGIGKHSLFGGKSVLYVLALSFGLQFLIGAAVNLWQLLDPQLLEQYDELMESSGVAEANLISAAATVLVAPVVEELTFRGLTVEYLKRMGAAFWVINVVQALLFGLAHLNPVQSTYAFFMGLGCGYLVLKYRSIWAGILCHMVFNGYSTLVSAVAAADPPFLVMMGGYVILGVLLLVWSLKRIRVDVQAKTEAEDRAEAAYFARLQQASGPEQIPEPEPTETESSGENEEPEKEEAEKKIEE